MADRNPAQSSGHPSGSLRRRAPWPLSTRLWLAGALAVSAAAALFYVYAWPWLAPPPEAASALDARWRRVNDWAAVDAACRAPGVDADVIEAGLLNSALYSERFAERRYPRLALSDLPRTMHAAMAKLMRWAERQGGIGAQSGDPGATARGLARVGLFALATAETREDPLLWAVVHTSRTLRRCGNLIQVLAGFELAHTLIRWARDRSVDADARLWAARPTADELFAALARDAVEVYELSRKSYPAGRSRGPWYVTAFVGVERELQWLRYERARLLFEANAQGREPRAIASLHAYDPEALPPSLLVRGTAVSAEASLRKAARTLEEYEAAFGPR